MDVLQVRGLEDLKRRLVRLPEKIQRVTLIKATKAGAQPILNAARAKVPVRSGLLARSIQVKFTRRSVSSVEASVGVFGLTRSRKAMLAKRIGKKGIPLTARNLQDPYYALWVEKGHRIVTRGQRGKTGVSRGQVAPRPFLRPAIDENVQRATDAVAQVLREEIDRAEQL